jgi:hypothetical protein
MRRSQIDDSAFLGAEPVMQEDRNVGGRTGLGRAAEILSTGKGHQALVAAQHLIEDAARLNAIGIVGDQEYGGIWKPEILAAQDMQDIIFDWPIAEGSVTAEPVSSRVGLLRYRNLTMADADIQKLRAVFDAWLAASPNERADLARRWWMHPAHKMPQQPADEDRFPLPLWAVALGLVSRIAQHRHIPPHAALTILGHALKAIIRTRILAEGDRKFLATAAILPPTDANLIRVRRLMQNIMNAELNGSPESRLRVLRLFDPDLASAAEATAELEEAARVAISSLSEITTLTQEIGVPAARNNGSKKSGPRPPEGRDDVIRQLLHSGKHPGRDVSWSKFCDMVRDHADGWADKRNGVPRRGFHEKAIKEAVDRILNARKDQGVG